ncbi:SWI/SNF- matrix-associated actin-dependent regulator of chromatin sub E member 1 [Bulinus truncatus]|nr:SWI/SNF- matrix-associated actin-dependent regulator of chromatin sub E member 1 [Bulinus truncatus]
MDNDLLTEVSTAELSLMSNSVDEPSDTVGLHVLTSDFVHDSDNVMNELVAEDCGRNVISIPTLASDIQNSVIGKDGEITLNSAFIPENAVLMETPRGLMLTVPENMAGITYCDDTSPNGSSRHVLSCIPVSLFSTCDNSVDVDASNVYDTEVSNESQLGDDSEEIAKQLQEDVDGVQIQLNEDDANGGSSGKRVTEPTLLIKEDITEACITKRKGGWPKGKRRKIKPTVMGPRAPVTGYVLYAMDRRKEIKESHPDITFPEVTKILGQEWSTMAPEVKDKYLAAADEDKKRYREELKAFRSSETYQETVRKKMMLSTDGEISSIQESTDILNCDEDISSELYCKVCQVYFSNLHNKREHMYGKAHIQNVAGEVEKELLRQQREEQAFLEGSLVVSEEMSQDEFSNTLRGNGNSCSSSTCSSTNCLGPSGPVDIHSFMMEFIQKNYEREQEISVLKKCLNKALQENVNMCKEIQALEEYENKLEEEIKLLNSTTSALIVQSDALKMVPTLFGIINL